MDLKELSGKVVAKAKEETTKESILHRISWSRVSKAASVVRSVAGTISGIALAATQIPGLNGDNKDWLLAISGITLAIAGRAWLTKGK